MKRISYSLGSLLLFCIGLGCSGQDSKSTADKPKPDFVAFVQYQDTMRESNAHGLRVDVWFEDTLKCPDTLYVDSTAYPAHASRHGFRVIEADRELPRQVFLKFESGKSQFADSVLIPDRCQILTNYPDTLHKDSEVEIAWSPSNGATSYEVSIRASYQQMGMIEKAIDTTMVTTDTTIRWKAPGSVHDVTGYIAVAGVVEPRAWRAKDDDDGLTGEIRSFFRTPVARFWLAGNETPQEH